MRRSRTLALVLPVVALAAVAVSLKMLRRKRQRHAEAVMESLRRPSAAPPPARDAAAPEGELPEPVRRYLELALPRGAARPQRVLLEQHGELRTGPASGRWYPFTATHAVAPDGPGYVWNARVEVAPFVHLRVLDSLLEGRGAGQVLLLSAIDVGHDRGTPEMNAGSLHRFLAEAAWYPWALLPSERLRWSPIDAHCARATLSVAGTRVSLEFRFGDDGEIAAIFTPARWGRFGGRYAQAAWEGRFFDYHRSGGVWMPRRGQVGWYCAGSLQWVWRGVVDGVSLR